MTPEQIKELALAGVRGETIKAISDEMLSLSKELAIYRSQLDLEKRQKDELRAALMIIRDGIDPYEDQLQNWIASKVDAAVMTRN